jgi:MoxR-like ATPase
VVAQAAQARGMNMIDLRLGQLAPTDLRGLPVADSDVARWVPPEFLPQESRHGASGILFLDEINMAPPAIQGVAQQLVLDRRVGSYRVPDGWYIWSAGNRFTDLATVYEMPAPLANRFWHYEVVVDLESFIDYAIGKGIDERIISYLRHRPTNLHRPPKSKGLDPAWPSPRTWEQASTALKASGVSVEQARAIEGTDSEGKKVTFAYDHASIRRLEAIVGLATSADFEAYLTVYLKLPDPEPILQGKTTKTKFPDEPSIAWAFSGALSARAKSADEGFNAMKYVVLAADRGEMGKEWVSAFTPDMLKRMDSMGQKGVFIMKCKVDPKIWEMIQAVIKSGMSKAGEKKP